MNNFPVTSERLGGGQEKHCLLQASFKIGPCEVTGITLTLIGALPLGYEPIAEYATCEQAEAVEDYRKRTESGEEVALVREGKFLCIWASKNPIWNL